MTTDEILRTHAADMPRDRQWTIDETHTVMKRMAIAGASQWADSVLRHRIEVRDMLLVAIDRGEMTRDEAAGHLEQASKDYQAEIDGLHAKVCDDIGLDDAADRQALATDIAAAFNRRCTDLMTGFVDTVGRA